MEKRTIDHPREFLKDYKGILMTDGYQVYHTLKIECPDTLNVSGCWSHCKRSDNARSIKIITMSRD